MKYHIHQWFHPGLKSSVFTLLVMSIFSNSAAFSIPQSDSIFAKKITDMISMCYFDSAIQLIDNYRKIDAANPLLPVLKLTTLGMRDVDLELTVDSTLFMNTYATAIKNITLFEQKHGITSYSRSLMGFAKSNYASFYIKQKMYFPALQTGMDAIKILREAKEIDSTNTDVDFFLGMYDYAKSELRKKLWMVMFWYPGGKKEGIQKLETCSKGAYITRNAALMSLSNIYSDEKMPEKAVKVIKQLSDSFPQSRFVYWAQVKYYKSEKKYLDAALVYNKLSLQYSNVKNGSYNSLCTKKSEAEMYYEAGHKEKVGPICKSILENPCLSDRTLKKETQKLMENAGES